MNAGKTIAIAIAMGLMSAPIATAAVNNVTSSGRIVPMGSLRISRNYAHRTAVGRPSPTTGSTQPVVVAQTPTEGRRFSYAPTDSPEAAGPCAAGGAASAPTATNKSRRFSYDPSMQSGPTASPAVPVYSSRHHAGRPSTRNSQSSVERWQLQKTDPRKYSTR